MKTHAAAIDQVHQGAKPADFLALTKPRLNLLVLITTLAGIYLAAPQGVSLALLLHTLFGTTFVAFGAAALNQVWERETDGLMRRTASRPLPAGRIRAGDGAWFGIALSAIGLLQLGIAVNGLTAAVAFVTLASYVLVYTPMKRRSSLSTLVGAIPGALPPVIGWTAVTNEITLPALVLFGIQFFWQMPHFLALAWIVREDYAAAGIPLLPTMEVDGRRTGHQTLLYTAVLWPVSLMPAVVGIAGAPYSVLATGLGFAFIALAALFAQQRTMTTARRLFFFSIVYLPLLWGALVADRLWL